MAAGHGPEPAASVTVDVSDGVAGRALGLGLDPDATDGFDPEFDRLAPPPPPAGAFDARIRGTDGGAPTDYYIDVRAYRPGGEFAFRLTYQASVGAGPIVLAWDPAALEGLGTFALASSPGPNPDFSLDMSTSSMLDTSQHPGLSDGAYVVWSDAALVAGEPPPPQLSGVVLRGPFPNPASAGTRLGLDLREPANVAVALFDGRGRRVLGLPVRSIPAGTGHTLPIDGAALPPGVYVYRITARMGTHTEILSGQLTLYK